MNILWITFKGKEPACETIRKLFLVSKFGYEYGVALPEYIQN